MTVATLTRAIPTVDSPSVAGPAQSAAVKPPLCKYVHCELTGQVIASRFVGFGSGDPGWIYEAVASYLDCAADELDCIDTDERTDLITRKGEVVAYCDCN
jgi:hypothetical protein